MRMGQKYPASSMCPSCKSFKAKRLTMGTRLCRSCGRIYNAIPYKVPSNKRVVYWWDGTYKTKMTEVILK